MTDKKIKQHSTETFDKDTAAHENLEKTADISHADGDTAAHDRLKKLAKQHMPGALDIDDELHDGE